MGFYKIDVDEEVWQFLKKNAEPFEDTPNSVLKRLLFGSTDRRVQTPFKSHTANDIPVFSPSIPAALAQILEVIYGVKKLGLSRRQATNLAAKKRGVTTQTIIDKYCRQLDKRAHDMDRLLEPSNQEGLQAVLLERFGTNEDAIREFFHSLAA